MMLAITNLIRIYLIVGVRLGEMFFYFLFFYPAWIWYDVNKKTFPERATILMQRRTKTDFVIYFLDYDASLFT
jgi:hypothetical protein